jgi:DNA-binding NarL/FixJ family response regulator
MYGDVEHVVHALQAGAAAYVLKKDADSELVTAIRTGRTEAPYLSPSIDRRLVEGQLRKSRAAAAQSEKYDPLTAREREVLQLVAEGRLNKQIASTLGIAVRTVEVHRSNIMRKLSVSDQASLVRYAVRKGIVSADE